MKKKDLNSTKSTLFFFGVYPKGGGGGGEVLPNRKSPYQKKIRFFGFYCKRGREGSHLFQKGFIIKYHKIRVSFLIKMRFFCAKEGGSQEFWRN